MALQTDGKNGPGPLMALLTLFLDEGSAADIFRMVRWRNGVFCPHCKGLRIIKWGAYRDGFQRYRCKQCKLTFNDKTGTVLHFWIGNWLHAIQAFFAGPPTGMSINHLAKSIGCSYKPTYYMMRKIMKKLSDLPQRMLSGTCETDEGYIKAASKGVRLAGNGEDRIMPSRRGMPRGPGRGTFKKDTPMLMVYHQRKDGDQYDTTIFDIPRGDKTLVELVGQNIEPGSTVITDEYRAYLRLAENYNHLTINHSEGEYAAGANNEIHTNNCECRIGQLKLWLKKHRGVSKWYLQLYVKSFQFIHNHRHYDTKGLFLVALAAILDQYPV